VLGEIARRGIGNGAAKAFERDWKRAATR